MECEFPTKNVSDDQIVSILKENKTIAVVGLSGDTSKASNMVARVMLDAGYNIIPVNPVRDEIMGMKCYKNLGDIPEPVGIVCLFRKPQDVPPFVDEAIEIGAKVVWMQLGIAHNESADKARSAGLQVVMNKCLKIEYQQFKDEIVSGE